MNSKTWVILLDCKHTAFYTNAEPAIDEIVYCRKCNGFRVVVEGKTEYKVTCRNCRYSSKFGAARLNAEGAAVRHRAPSSRSHHIVDVILGRKIVQTYGVDSRQRSLLDSSYDEDSEDQPPF